MEYNIKTKIVNRNIKLSVGQADVFEVLIKMNGTPLQAKEIAKQLDEKYKLSQYKTSVYTVKRQIYELRVKTGKLIRCRPSFGYFIDEEIKISKEPKKEEPKKTYELGLIVGTKRERDYWKNKIKEKIEELKEMLRKITAGEPQKYLPGEICHFIYCYEELLKEEGKK